MDKENQSRQVVRFGVYEVDLRTGELSRQGMKVKLHGQPFEVLGMLLEHPGELVTREEIQKRLWPSDTFVDFEHGLNKAINRIREALGDDADNARFVETLPRRGYRFIYPVDVGAGLRPAPTVARVSPPATETAVRDRRYSRRWLVALAAGGLVAVLAGLLVFNLAGLRDRLLQRPAPAPPFPPLRAVPFTSFPGMEGSPSFSPDGSQIAFEWNGEKEDNWDIYVKVIGTESVLRLTTNKAADRAPAWSPDGRYIAFHREMEKEDEIYLIPALGGPERKLCSGQFGDIFRPPRLTWSPDQKSLAFSRLVPGGVSLRILLLSLETLETKPLTFPSPPVPGDDWFPEYSPDGKTLAFVRDTTFLRGDIYLASLAGGEPTRLTEQNTKFLGHSWTPDGTHLVFSSLISGANSGLWKVPVSGGEPEQLPVGRENALWPTVSRDGRRLAFVQSLADTNIWRYEVARVAGQQNLPTKLIASTAFDSSHNISPDGKRIAFSSSRSGIGLTEIWVCDSDGSNVQQLTHFDTAGVQAGTPRWSPDGRQIAFDCDAAGQFDIYVVNSEGGPPRRLTSEKSDDFLPSWSRDGRWIYFSSGRSGNSRVWKMPAGGGQAVQVTKSGGQTPFESYDGKTLYWSKRLRQIWKVPVEGGEETLVFELPVDVPWGFWALAQDGIYFYNHETRAIEFISFTTRKTTKVLTPERPPNPCCRGLSVSPDGQWILYSQLDNVGSDIMLVENFRW